MPAGGFEMAEEVCNYEINRVAEQINYLSAIEGMSKSNAHECYYHKDESSCRESDEISKDIDRGITELKNRLQSLVRCIIISKK